MLRVCRASPVEIARVGAANSDAAELPSPETSFTDVDDGWGWEPTLLAWRRDLDAVFEAALCATAMTPAWDEVDVAPDAGRRTAAWTVMRGARVRRPPRHLLGVGEIIAGRPMA